MVRLRLSRRWPALGTGRGRWSAARPAGLARPARQRGLRGGRMTARPLIGFGHVWHRRLRPVEHAFRYPGYFLMLPLRSLRTQPDAALRRNRRGGLGSGERRGGEEGGSRGAAHTLKKKTIT